MLRKRQITYGKHHHEGKRRANVETDRQTRRKQSSSNSNGAGNERVIHLRVKERYLG